MSKIYFVILVLIFAILFEIGVFSRFFQDMNLSLVLALIFIITLNFRFEESLVLALASGFILDISTLERFPFWTLFLALTVVTVTLIQRKFIDFSHGLSALLGLIVICLLRVAIQFSVFGESFFSLSGLYNFLSNALLCLIVFGLWILIKNKWKITQYEERSKGF